MSWSVLPAVLALTIAPLVIGCGEPDSSAELDGPPLTLVGLEPTVLLLDVCFRPEPRRSNVKLSLAIEAFLEREAGSPEPLVVGLERKLEVHPWSVEQSAFARLGDASELRLEWQDWFHSCRESDLVFGVLEGPVDATVHVEWFVTAEVQDDTRTEVLLDIR